MEKIPYVRHLLKIIMGLKISDFDDVAWKEKKRTPHNCRQYWVKRVIRELSTKGSIQIIIHQNGGARCFVGWPFLRLRRSCEWQPAQRVFVLVAVNVQECVPPQSHLHAGLRAFCSPCRFCAFPPSLQFEVSKNNKV
ncbi:hypothetical protein PIB30_029090 [Stylosanthes scabra]|uniref:Uncharacterized protein n=1 Tax=Stylosanthes scabra TaxID=79078 RepID=A0ABU6TBF4_9FABA|nr:hypothetical protein [Stylosanthes scabra]